MKPLNEGIMTISRRAFLKYCIGASTLLGLDVSVVGNLNKLLAEELTMPNIVWLEGSACSGCSVSLANLIGDETDQGPTDLVDLLTSYVNLSFAKTFMSATGDAAVSQLKDATAGEFILVVEGGIPTAFDGMACTVYTADGQEVTMSQAVSEYAPKASMVVCVGTCASFGGIPASGSNPTGVVTVQTLTGIPTINLPGCPAHPDWIAGTLAAVICGQMPELDDLGRPNAFYGKTIHSQCPRKPLYDQGRFADYLGQEGQCLFKLGCQGPYTYADCPTRGWNNGYNYCVQSNSNCIGCVEPGFPSSTLITRRSHRRE